MMGNGNGRQRAVMIAVSALSSVAVIATAGGIWLELQGRTSPPWVVGIVAAIIGWLSGLITPVPRDRPH